MALFCNDNGVLKCRLHGENLWLLPWGKNALRVVSRPMSEPELPAWALLEPAETASEIKIEGNLATMIVGKLISGIAAVLLALAIYRDRTKESA